MKKNALSELARRTTAPPISWLMQKALDHPHVISLAAGFTDNESLPVDETRVLLEQILGSKTSGRASLQYGTSAGDPELRRLTAQDLQTLDTGKPAPNLAEAYSTERLLITNGSQQLLYIVTEALCDPGDIVLLEDPTYFVYLGITESRGVRTRGIRLEEDGIDLAHLEQILESLKRSGDLPRVKMLYLVSYFQNPSSITTSFAKKRAALALLRQYERTAGHPIYLLEDAAYRGLRFKGAPSEKSALAARSFADRVIYAGTYSKPFATGARVGFGILPRELFDVVLWLKGGHDFGTSNLLQQLMRQALITGAYQRHLADLQLRYFKKAQVMLHAIREHFPVSMKWLEPHGGLYVWARAHRSIRTGIKSKFFQTALDREVFYVPGQLCYAHDPARRRPDHEMRLSFGGATERDIREGIARLGAVARANAKR